VGSNWCTCLISEIAFTYITKSWTKGEHNSANCSKSRFVWSNRSMCETRYQIPDSCYDGFEGTTKPRIDLAVTFCTTCEFTMFKAVSLYNKEDEKNRVRIGNWVEEQALHGYNTSDSSFRGATYERCIAHNDTSNFSKIQSSNTESHSRQVLVGSVPPQVGPRSSIRDKLLFEQAQRETEEKKVERSYYETNAQEAYGRTPAFVSKVGRRVMKTQIGQPIPVEARDQEFLSSFGISKPPARLSAQELDQMVPKGPYDQQTPVTVYTQRVTEGVYKTSGGGARATFGRSSAFTNETTDGRNAHSEGVDDASGDVDLKRRPPRPAPGGELSLKVLVKKVKAAILALSGSDGLQSLKRLLRKLDDSGDGRLSQREFTRGLRDFGLSLTAGDADQIFTFFDLDRSGYLSVEELMKGLRGDLSEFRKELVDMAFARLDKTGDGIITIDDLEQCYDVSQLPEVASGKLTPRAALEKFMSQWDSRDHDGVITRDEFYDYYKNVGGGIESDKYFELMVRNAWHISGGTGASANTTCRRVLVIHRNGQQTIEEIEDDLGVAATDTQTMIKFLEEVKGLQVAEVKLCN
jgi:Ca2+-binding EF-hand superfamily protein